jgi:transcriptional regulator GlxA family with amidase domain
VDQRIEQAILLISTRFREPLTLPDIAGHVALSPFHLHRLFKA